MKKGNKEMLLEKKLREINQIEEIEQAIKLLKLKLKLEKNYGIFTKKKVD